MKKPALGGLGSGLRESDPAIRDRAGLTFWVSFRWMRPLPVAIQLASTPVAVAILTRLVPSRVLVSPFSHWVTEAGDTPQARARSLFVNLAASRAFLMRLARVMAESLNLTGLRGLKFAFKHAKVGVK